MMMNQNGNNNGGRGNTNNLEAYQLDQLISAAATLAAAPVDSGSAAAGNPQTLIILEALLQWRQQPEQLVSLPQAQGQGQVQGQVHRPSPTLAETTAVSTTTTATSQAQAILKHHEDRLRQARLILEHQDRSGNLQQQPLLLASSAMAEAMEAQKRILGGLADGGVAARPGPATAAMASATTNEAHQDRSGSLQRHPLLLASNSKAETQKRILGGLADGTAAATVATGPATAAMALATTNDADERLDCKIAAQEEQIGPLDMALRAGEDDEANLKRPAEESEDEEKHSSDHQGEGNDGDEGYDDKMTDEEYFKNFNASDDNRVIQETFPLKLYRMLYEVEKSGKENIISFLPHGKSFLVHRPKSFVEEVMPKYFTTCRLASFQRQLNLYGFRRITEGREKGAYSHDCFLKGKRALCRKVKRQRTRVKIPQSHSFPSSSSSFSSFPSSSSFSGVPSQPLASLTPSASLPGNLAAAAAAAVHASNPNLRGLIQAPAGVGLTPNSTSALLGRLTTGNSSLQTAARAMGVRAGVGVGDNVVVDNILEEAIRRGFLSDVNAARQPQQGLATAAAAVASTNDSLITTVAQELLKQKLQEQQEVQLIIQSLRQQQQQQQQLETLQARRQHNQNNQQ